MLLLLAFACGPEDPPSVPVIEQPWNPDHETTAVVATVARDYTVGALATVDLDTFQIREELATISGDARVAFDDGTLIVLNGYGVDTVRLYEPGAWSAPRIELGMSDGSPTNPHDAAICDGKLFVLLYETDAIAIHDPDSGEEIGSVPLGGYADDDGLPEPWNLVEIDGALYVALNRLDRDDAWSDRGGLVVEVSCDEEKVVRTWSTAGNPMVHRWDDDARILVSTRAYASDPGGLSILDTRDGSYTPLVAQEALGGTADEATAFGSHAIVAALATDYESTALQCVDLETGDVETIDTTADFVTAVVGNDRGEAWIGTDWGWVDPDAAQPRLRVFDVATCAEWTGEPLRLDLAPYSLTFY
jgi:hypothetical protein